MADSPQLDELEELVRELREIELQQRELDDQQRLIDGQRRDLDARHVLVTQKMHAALEQRTRHIGLAKANANLRPDASVAKRIIEILESTPSQFYTPELLTQKIGGSKLETVRSTLSRLLKEGRIAKVGRNGYHGLRAEAG